MDQKLTFKSWKRSTLFDLAMEKGPTGRLEGRMPLTITDTVYPNGIPELQQASDEVPFTLMAACDVAGLKPDAIKHMVPAPFTRDAETTKLVHLDLWDPGLPWRYTPEKKVHGAEVRPWMVLLVGTAKEIQVQGGIANVDKAVLLDHDLRNSYLWAHVQTDGTVEIGRILSPRGLLTKDENGYNKFGLLAQHQYVAALVPAFNDEGNDMWSITGPDTVQTNFGKKGILPAFHSWQFMTAEGGDFETLAAKLYPSQAGDVGKAKLYYRRNIETDNLHINEVLEIRGAITSLQQEPEQQFAVEAVRADLDILNNHLDNCIGLPEYGAPWLANPDEVLAGWPADVNDDARFRGIAGLGLWMGIEAQEALVEAAVQQSGALREAGQRIGNLALGLMAAGSLWNRHLPTDKHERLRTLGPIMGRMLASGGGWVLSKITENSPLTSALFSSAAQRILRDRSTQTRHVTGANGGLNRTDAMNEANRLEQLPQRVPDGLPHIDTIAKEMGLKMPDELLQVNKELLTKIWEELIDFIDSYCKDYLAKRESIWGDSVKKEDTTFREDWAGGLFKNLFSLLQTLLSNNHLHCESMAMIENIGQSHPGGTDLFFERVLENGVYQQILKNDLWKALYKCMAMTPCQKMQSINAHDIPVGNIKTFCNDLIDALSPPPVHDKRPVDLGGLSDLIFNALDPRQMDAPAKLRLCSRIKGLDCTRLIRPEFKVGLDFPTWELLKKYDKEWLLPGVNALEKDSVLALQTNPEFIDAFLLGINTQFMSEMRWRDIAVDRTCTPLRMFWGQVNYKNGLRQADIEPLAQWAKTPSDSIGALSHQTILSENATNTTGNRLVIVFRSDLFRRYPSTLVYLVKPAEGEDVDALLMQVPVLEPDEISRADKKFFGPVFMGIITPEITFFSFDVSPLDLDKYWLVLDEPPAELRFRNDKILMNKPLNAAAFAFEELDQPTRVARSGNVLKN